MNNQTIYSKRLAGFTNVQAAYEREQASFTKWAGPRAFAHILNAKAILYKYNQSRPSEKQVWPEAMPWAHQTTHSFKIESFDETHIVFSYKIGYHKPTSETFKFPIEWLSLSTWDFNKRVREEIKKEVARRELNRKRDAEAKARQLRKTIWDAQATIKAQTEELKKLEEVYSS